MSTWYRTNRWQNTIVPVEIIGETAQYVTLAPDGGYKTGRRSAKGHEYFPTFAEARTDLMDYFNGLNASHKAQMEQAHIKWLKLFLQEAPDKETK